MCASPAEVSLVDHESSDMPSAQYLAPDVVLYEMAEAGARRSMGLRVSQILILSTLAGAFITVGALFSTLIAAGTENEGAKRVLEGFGFSAGFFLVVLSGALLFTEVNVELPATLFDRSSGTVTSAVLRLWVLAAVGNLIGAFVAGQIINFAQVYDDEYRELLGEIVEAKMRYRSIGGVDGFFRGVVSGVLGNWLVGMAAFLATMGRTIIGKYIPVLITVMAFVASGFMHSPANMGFLSLIEPLGDGPGWVPGLAWAVAPAAIGNVAGAFFLVALPFWLVRRSR